MLGLEDIIGLEVISSDARVMGVVEGIGIDIPSWKVLGLRVGLRRGLEESIGRRRHVFAVERVQISTAEVDTVSDTVILQRPISSAGEVIITDDSSLVSAGGLMGMRVICRNARQIGTVDNLILDPDHGWAIPYLQVKLDKEVVESLNMRQHFLSAPVTVIRTSDIRAMGDMIMLDITFEQLREFLESGPSTSSGQRPAPSPNAGPPR